MESWIPQMATANGTLLGSISLPRYQLLHSSRNAILEYVICINAKQGANTLTYYNRGNFINSIAKF